MTTPSGRTDAPAAETTLRAWLALVRAPDIGPRTLLPLLAESPDPASWFDNPPTSAPRRLRNYLRSPDWDGVDRDQSWLEAPDRHLIRFGAEGYPALLARLPDPPIALFVQGQADLLGLPQLAMVGSRNPTAGGKQTAHEFARHLAASGLVITSGMALGIDAAAHRGALQGGTTIAVTGTGLARVYPASHRELAHQISAQGALVSEFPPETPPLAGHFPRRNRLISGLSAGTLVVEATLKSGSLITARLALEQGREVFAIPGSIHNPMARGCHALIREGAKLVETAQDIVEEIVPLLGEFRAEAGLEPPTSTDLLVQHDPDHERLLEAMGHDPIAVDTLIARTGFLPEAVSSMLLLLELEGHVSSQAGGLFTRTGKPLA
jgi:DNA processing protein